jgi:hypothetical protein
LLPDEPQPLISSSNRQSVMIEAKLRFLLFIAHSSSRFVKLICDMTLSTCPSFAVILVPLADIPPVPGMGIRLAAAVALHADIRIRMARLARLQVPPRFRGMIRVPVIDLRGARLAMRFDAHAPLRACLAVAVGTEIRLVAAIAVLGIVRRLDRVDGNEIGPM